MKYINTKTGAMIDSPCLLSGENWVAQLEDDGKVHVRPVKDGVVLDTPIESIESYKETKRTPKKR